MKTSVQSRCRKLKKFDKSRNSCTLVNEMLPGKLANLCDDMSHLLETFHLPLALQAVNQLELAAELLPMILKVPLAEPRCSAQAHLWGAVIDLDLATRLARRSGEKGPPASELRSLLTDTFVVETVAAKENGELPDPFSHSGYIFFASWLLNIPHCDMLE